MTKISITDGTSEKTSTQKFAEEVIKAVEADSKKSAKIAVSAAEPVAKPAAKSTQHHTGAAAAATHNTLQKSTTLSRRYVQRPSARKTVSDIRPVGKAKHTIDTAKSLKAAETAAKPTKKSIRAEKKATRIAAKENERALKLAAKSKSRALKQAAKTSAKQPSDAALRQAAKLADTIKEAPEEFTKVKHKRNGRKVFFALVCSAATVSALVAFVHFNMPDITVRVAAMQTGIEATYPSFIPRDYSLSGVSSEKDGEIIMTFAGQDGATFTLSETSSTWDSNAVLTNYVKKSFDHDYTTLREQGITIYVGGGDAAWVNGGILYKIKAVGNWLTKEQIRNIATSL